MADSSIDEYLPSISPDGTEVCFTISNNTFNGSAEVMVAPLTSGAAGIACRETASASLDLGRFSQAFEQAARGAREWYAAPGSVPTKGRKPEVPLRYRGPQGRRSATGQRTA